MQQVEAILGDPLVESFVVVDVVNVVDLLVVLLLDAQYFRKS